MMFHLVSYPDTPSLFDHMFAYIDPTNHTNGGTYSIECLVHIA